MGPLYGERGILIPMDLDAYVGARHDAWQRLEVLVAQRRLSGAESDELLRLYTEVSTDLSTVRSINPDPALVRYLSALLSRARIHTAGARSGSWGALHRFLVVTFPAALYRLRWWWIAVTVACVGFGFAVGWYAHAHPEVYTSQLTPAQIDAYVNTDFANYYSEYPHHEFATLVWTNNAWVAAQCIAFGVLGLPVVYVLFQNVMGVGVAGALMASHDRLDLFFGLILPHGILEADRDLRRWRGGAAAVLVVDRARSAHSGAVVREGRPHRHQCRARPRARAPRQWHHRGVRHPLRTADLGADQHWRDRPGGLPRVCVRPRSPRRARG